MNQNTDSSMADLDWQAARRSLRGGWACVARLSELPRESFSAAELDGDALVLTRDRDGTVRAFHNVCSHRGHPLAAGPCTRATRMSCPYHGWSYGLDGRLRSTPHIGGAGVHEVEGFQREKHGLVSLACSQWWDFVFINLDGAAPPFASWIAPLERRWERFLGAAGVTAYVPVDEPGFRLDVQGPWSLAIENYCESYHLPFVHPGLNSYSRIEDHYTIAEPGHFAGQGTNVFEARYLQGAALPSLPQWPAQYRTVAEYVAVFPNLMLGIHHDHAFSVRLEPVDATRTVEHCDLYMLETSATGEDFAPARARTRDAWISVFEEDIPVVEGMTRGRRSPAYSGGAFSPVLETGSMTFYEWIHACDATRMPVRIQST